MQGPDVGVEVRAEVIDLLLGFMNTQVVAAGVHVGLADALPIVGPAPLEHLAQECGVPTSRLDRLLQAWNALGLAAKVGDDSYLATARTATLTRSGSLHAAAKLVAGPDYAAWAALREVIRSDTSGARCAWGDDYWSELQRQPTEIRDAFAQTMQSNTSGLAAWLAANWHYHPDFEQICDVGGASGHLLLDLLDDRPDAEGVVFDLAIHRDAAMEEFRSRGHARGRFIEGDARTGKLPPCDAVVIKHVLHNWNDQAAAAILDNLRRSMAPGTHILIIESSVPPATPTGREALRSAMADLDMMVLHNARNRPPEWYEDTLRSLDLTICQTLADAPSGHIAVCAATT